MHSYNWKELPITDGVIEHIELLAGVERRQIIGYGYPLFEWDPSIETNKAMTNDEKENIMVGEEITIQHEENHVNTEI